MTKMLEPKSLYLQTFQNRGKELAGKDPAWVKGLREKAMASFEEKGFPTVEEEIWRYTDLTTSLLQVPFGFEMEFTSKTSVSARLKGMGFDVEKAHLVVFVNGRFSKEQSSIKNLPAGANLTHLAELSAADSLKPVLGQVVPSDGRPFAALNMAYFTDGLILQVPKGKSIPEPIHVVHLSVNASTNTQSHPRNLVVLEEDSQALLIEHYLDEAVSPYLTNSVTEVRLSRGASLEHVKIQQESAKAYHLGTLVAKQAEGSRFASCTYSLGGVLARHEVETTLSEKKAECLMEGLYLARGKQHVDTRTFVDHLAPACKSEEVFKGVLDDEAVGIFDGRILVRENAQKTDARQSNKNLQLSKKSQVYSKPQLQIYADDVKCSHGSATGQMDEEALFYLQSRGIGREEARQLLVYAFAGEMLDRIPFDYLKHPLRQMVNDWMGAKP